MPLLSCTCLHNNNKQSALVLPLHSLIQSMYIKRWEFVENKSTLRINNTGGVFLLAGLEYGMKRWKREWNNGCGQSQFTHVTGTVQSRSSYIYTVKGLSYIFLCVWHAKFKECVQFEESNEKLPSFVKLVSPLAFLVSFVVSSIRPWRVPWMYGCG